MLTLIYDVSGGVARVLKPACRRPQIQPPFKVTFFFFSPASLTKLFSPLPSYFTRTLVKDVALNATRKVAVELVMERHQLLPIPDDSFLQVRP